MDVVASLGGAASWAELTGVPRRRLYAALRQGSLRRLGPRLLACPDPDEGAVARALGGALSHVSAARSHGFALLQEPKSIHVTVPKGANRRVGPAVTLHRRDLTCDDLGRGEVSGGGPQDSSRPYDGRRTSPLRTVVDCARLLSLPEALAVADSALRSGLVSAKDVSEVRLRGPGSGGAARALRAADGRAESALESALRGVLLEGHLSSFVPQFEVQDRGRFVARVDLADTERRVALEADGYAWHGTREALARDWARQNELHALGWVVLRFTWEHIVGHPHWVRQKVLAVLERRAVQKHA